MKTLRQIQARLNLASSHLLKFVNGIPIEEMDAEERADLERAVRKSYWQLMAARQELREHVEKKQ